MKQSVGGTIIDYAPILSRLCDSEQEQFRREIAIAYPEFSEEEVTDFQVAIVKWLDDLGGRP